jgi:hypothetical protein
MGSIEGYSIKERSSANLKLAISWEIWFFSLIKNAFSFPLLAYDFSSNKYPRPILKWFA